jgi:diguanylate cyclase (GGDEF)-like protein
MTTMETQENETVENRLDHEVMMPCLQIGKLLTSTRNLHEILSLIMAKISQLVDAENWSLLLADDETGELYFEVVVGLDKAVVNDIRIPAGVGIAGIVAQKGEPLFIEDAEKDGRVYREVDRRSGFTTKSIICLPLKTHGKTLGVIEIVNLDDLSAFRKTKFPALSILADYAAIAIENSRYLSKIHRMSITDEYTGLYNARYMHTILPELLQHSETGKNRIAVAFADIDNFKQVVDTHGHLAGSTVLREIGETISGFLGNQDLLIKYGGDEFILILPGCSKEEALKLCQEILNHIRGSIYLQHEKNPVKITASFGIAVFPDDARTYRDLLLQADDCMYRIKKSTKNSVGVL